MKEHLQRKDLHMVNWGHHGEKFHLFVYPKAQQLISLTLGIFIGLFLHERGQKGFTKNVRHSFNMKIYN